MNKEYRKSERGSANTKLIIFLVAIGLIAHGGYNYLPVMYQGESFKQEMHTAVVNGVSMPVIGKTAIDVVKEKLAGQIRALGIPATAVVEVKAFNNAVQARVAYTRKVNILPFGLYTYDYQFDNTETPSGYLSK